MIEMAIQFANTSSTVYAYYANVRAVVPPYTTFPAFTVAVWFRSDTVAAVIQATGPRIGGASDKIYLRTSGNGTNITAQAAAVAGGGAASFSSSASTFAANTWVHMAGVFTSSTSRTVYLNGVAGTVDSVSRPTDVPSTQFDITYGVDDDGINGTRGSIAEGCIWYGSLTALEIAALAARISPLRIRPDQIVSWYSFLGSFTSYPPMAGTGMALRVLIGGAASPVVVDHPSIFYMGQVGSAPQKNLFVPQLKTAVESVNRDLEFLVELSTSIFSKGDLVAGNSLVLLRVVTVSKVGGLTVVIS